MTQKELMEGLNEIDDELVEEAREYGTAGQKKAPEHRTRGQRLRYASLIPGMAACAAVAFMGTVIYEQHGQIEELSLQMQSRQLEDSDSAIGLASAESVGNYQTADGYGAVYDLLEKRAEMEKQSNHFGLFSGKSTTYDLAREEVAAESGTETTAAGYGFSRTNLMTEQVDESDIVKTDGSFIYMVQSGSIKITDIREGSPGESVNVTPQGFEAADSILELYVDGSDMVIIASHYQADHPVISNRGFQEDAAYRNSKEETVCYVYDVTNPMEPVYVDKMTQDGTYKTSRKVEDEMYLFTEQYLEYPGYDRKTALSEEHIAEWIPSINGRVIASDCIYLPEEGYQGLLVSSFSVDRPDRIDDAKYIVNDWCEVYVSQKHIYLYSTDYTGSYTVTNITDFSFSGGRITANTSGSVKGEITDRFAIHEKDGYLRVLTTDYSGSSEVNTLFVLDSNLKQVGRLDEIARGERIYAARYVGDLVYFVTYRNTDPLFAVDLSEPTQPKMLGELKVTGFSEYLHFWDENHILGIGYETTEDSQTVGIKLTMFDCTDPADLKVAHSKVLKGKEYSSAFYNYKEFLADPVKNIIGFASLDYDKSDDTTYDMFTYDPSEGFQKVWSQGLMDGDTSSYRGLYSGDHFYIAGNGTIWDKEIKLN